MIKRLLFIMSFLCVIQMYSYAQEFHINDLNATNGSFQYSRGDSIYIAGENDTVSLSDSLTMDLEAPKILIEESTTADRFSTGSFKAFYDSYKRIVVSPEIQSVDENNAGEIVLNIEGGAPPYEIKWLSFENSDSLLFSETLFRTDGFDYSSFMADIRERYHNDALSNLGGGKYTCIVQDSRMSRSFSFIVGNQQDNLQLVNCDLINGDITLQDSYTWGKCGFNYSSVLPDRKDWSLGYYTAADADDAVYSVGLSDTTLLVQDSTDLLVGVHMNKGYLYPVIDGSLISPGMKIQEGDGIIFSKQGEQLTIFVNGHDIAEYDLSGQENMFLKGGILSGNLNALEMYYDLDFPLVPQIPIGLLHNVELNVTDLICGLDYSGQICSSRPGWTIWPAGFNGASGCISGVPAGTYTLTIDPPLSASYTRIIRVGYEAIWENVNNLQEYGMSGLENNTSSVGYARSSQEVTDMTGSNWAEFEFEYDEYGGSIVLGIANGTLFSQSPWNGICVFLTLDPSTNQILVQGLDNSGTHNFGVAPMSSNVVRISASQSNWTVSMEGLTPDFVMTTPDLTGAKAFVQISPGENMIEKAITSFGCEEVVSYAKLSKKTGGQLIPVSGSGLVLHFSYEEPYLDDGTGTQIELTRYSGNDTYQNNLAFNPEYGYHEYDIDISSYGFLPGDTGLLTLISEKGEKWYLKFRIE